MSPCSCHCHCVPTAGIHQVALGVGVDGADGAGGDDGAAHPASRPSTATRISARGTSILGGEKQIRVETGAVTGVAGGTHLIHFEEHGVAVAVETYRVHVLRVSRRLPLDPVLATGTREVGALT